MQDILVIASTQAASAFADALRREHDYNTSLATDRSSALDALRRQEFTLILLDEAMGGADLNGADLFYKHAGAATLLEFNFVLERARLLRQVRGALVRRAQDRASARTSAQASLEGELGASLTGLLLESQLALRSASPALAPRLRHLVMLAGDLQNRLRA